MERFYIEGKVPPLTLPTYAPLVCAFLERLRPDQWIHRIMADTHKGPGLLAPAWSGEKQASLQFLHRYMEEHDVVQGGKCRLPQ